MTEAVELSCRKFVEVLASDAPAPGGGGAAALVGAIGMALGNMVGSLTVDKPKYAPVRDELVSLMDQAQGLREELLDLVEADARAFEPLSRAYGLPSGTDKEKAEKARVMETCLRDAAAVPFEIMQACCGAIDLLERFCEIGTPLAISDVGCGAACCRAAMQAASLNVFVNTKLLADRAHATARDDAAYDLLDTYLPKADAIIAEVGERLR